MSMAKKVQSALAKINSHLRKNAFLNAIESQSIQSIILPILDALGWDFANPKEVLREYPVGKKRGDVVLCANNNLQVLIEAKAIGHVNASAKKQARFYAEHLQIPIVIVTDGQEWFFYSLENGVYTESPCSLNIREMPLADCADVFYAFLSREEVISNRALPTILNASDTLSVYNDPFHPESKFKITGISFRGKEYRTRFSVERKKEISVNSTKQVYFLTLELFAEENKDFLKNFKRISQLRGGYYRASEDYKELFSKQQIDSAESEASPKWAAQLKSGWYVTSVGDPWFKVLLDAACGEMGIVYNEELKILTKPKT